jgi:hypothetical protein
MVAAILEVGSQLVATLMKREQTVTAAVNVILLRKAVQF